MAAALVKSKSLPCGVFLELSHGHDVSSPLTGVTEGRHCEELTRHPSVAVLLRLGGCPRRTDRAGRTDWTWRSRWPCGSLRSGRTLRPLGPGWTLFASGSLRSGCPKVSLSYKRGMNPDTADRL